MNIDKINQQILEHLSNGFTVKEIAPKVFISIGAVKKRIGKMLKKTGSKNNVELACWWKANCNAETPSS